MKRLRTMLREGIEEAAKFLQTMDWGSNLVKYREPAGMDLVVSQSPPSLSVRSQGHRCVEPYIVPPGIPYIASRMPIRLHLAAEPHIWMDEFFLDEVQPSRNPFLSHLEGLFCDVYARILLEYRQYDAADLVAKMAHQIIPGHTDIRRLFRDGILDPVTVNIIARPSQDYPGLVGMVVSPNGIPPPLPFDMHFRCPDN
jgi:hypothetical protein